MLTVPIDVIADLLDKASIVELSVLEMIEDEETAEPETADAVAEDDDAENPDDDAYRELVAAIEALSPDQVYELLTLAQLGAEESEAETWDEAAAEARAIPEDVTGEELIRALVLTDAIENALEQLGYTFEDDDDDDDDMIETEDEDEDDDDEEEDEADRGKDKNQR
ncbi:MAG TPA: DUF3775 domain-containing protein [Stellaceae bacterium]|nr:DUF3775 domain-containing protein [Stellaceae bacterium]